MTDSTDSSTPIADLKAAVQRFADERDWRQFHSPKNLAMALAAEAAELMEHFLWVDGAQSAALLEEPARAAQIREELADIFIYTMQFANISGIDLAAAAREKMALNALKYPVEKARGKALKYTELDSGDKTGP